jgi:uncharacterized protein (TIGR03437 family)
VQIGFSGPAEGFIATFFPAAVYYAGPAPFEIGGMYQINVQVPAMAVSGAVYLTVTAPDGTSYSTQALLAIQ